ncbi:hypothetical protein CEXT_544881, partial [Caerostris extrusa]
GETSSEISRQQILSSYGPSSRTGDGPVTARFMTPFKALDLGRYQTKFSVLRSVRVFTLEADTAKRLYRDGRLMCVSLSVDYEGSG